MNYFSEEVKNFVQKINFTWQERLKKRRKSSVLGVEKNFLLQLREK